MDEQQISSWKQQYGDVFEVTVDGKKGYFKKPDRKTMGFAMTKAQTDPLGYLEVIIENCWLGGDNELKDNNDYFYALCMKVQDITAVKDAEIKKL